MNGHFDVVIVGAGPAGSWAALNLALAGRSVLLTDRSFFPRTKVCGGCLSGPACRRLRKLAKGKGMPGADVSRICFRLGEYELSVRPAGATRMACRAELDDWMVRQAIACGAEVRLGQAACLVPGVRGWEVRLAGEGIVADDVLLGCGLGRIPKELGILNRTVSKSMVAQQWIEPLRSGLPAPGEVELHWLDGGYVGLASPDDSGCVVAMAAEPRVINGCGPLEGLRRLNPRNALWDRLPADSGRVHESKGAAAFPWIPDRLGDRNLLLIGDAAGYAEPFSGTGMSQAMYSAECATGAIMKGGDALRHYTLMMRRHRRAVRRTLMLSAMLRSAAARLLASHRVRAIEPWLSRLVERVHVRGNC